MIARFWYFLSISNFFKKTLSGFAILSNLLYLPIFSPVEINSLHSWELLSLTVLDIIECPDKNWARRWNCFRHYSSPYLKYYWGWYIEGFSGRENLLPFFPKASRLDLLSLPFILCKIWRLLLLIFDLDDWDR